jgi:hypothetical protein
VLIGGVPTRCRKGKQGIGKFVPSGGKGIALLEREGWPWRKSGQPSGRRWQVLRLEVAGGVGWTLWCAAL